MHTVTQMDVNSCEFSVSLYNILFTITVLFTILLFRKYMHYVMHKIICNIYMYNLKFIFNY